MARPRPCSHHLATRLLNQAPAWMPARTVPPAAGWTPATSSSAMPPCTRAQAFPLGLGVLASKGVTAWRHALAGLAPAATGRAAPAARPAQIPAPVAAELISALAAVALAGSVTGPAP